MAKPLQKNNKRENTNSKFSLKEQLSKILKKIKQEI